MKVPYAKKWRKEADKLRKIMLDCDLTEEMKWGKRCFTSEPGRLCRHPSIRTLFERFSRCRFIGSYPYRTCPEGFKIAPEACPSPICDPFTLTRNQDLGWVRNGKGA